MKGQERKVENLSEQILEIEAEFNKTTIKYHEIQKEYNQLRIEFDQKEEGLQEVIQ